MAVHNQKSEVDLKSKVFESDMDYFIKMIQKELDALKSTMMNALSKKVDQVSLEQF